MNPKSKPADTPAPAPVALWIGLDWADQKHFLACRPTDGSAGFSRQLPQKPEELESCFLELRQRYPRIAICVEQTRGPLIHGLMKFDFLVIYPVNPRSLAEFRRVFKVGGAKSDPADGELLAELGLRHAERLRALEPQDAATRQLALLGEHRRDLVQERTQCLNRLASALKSYYPQALELVGAGLDTPMALDFLVRWPTLPLLQKARPSTLRGFFYTHNSRGEEILRERLALVASAKPLTEDPAVVEPMRRLALAMVRLVGALQKTIAEYDAQIAEVFAGHAKAPLFAGLPGAGPVLAPRLAAALGTLPSHWPSAHELLCLSGVAPVTRQSGRQRTVHFRWARPKFLHQTFVEFAKCSIPHCGWAALLYQDLLKRGKGRWAAIRVVAFKWVRIIRRCWADNSLYDETRYLRSLQKQGVKLYEPLYANLPGTDGKTM